MRHIENAIVSGNPYIFGAVLHQVQDYYSHWGEGYGEKGHAEHTARRTEKLPSRRSDFFDGGHTSVVWDEEEWKWKLEWIESPYPAHPEEDVRRYLQRTNPGAGISELDQNDLIELYLRKDEGRDPNWLKRFEMRDHFGFDPDRYIQGSWRDNIMEWSTRYYIRKYVDQIVTNPCSIDCRGDVDEIVDEVKEYLTD